MGRDKQLKLWRRLSLLKKLVIPSSVIMFLAFVLLGVRIVQLVEGSLNESLERRITSFLSFVQQSSAPLIYNFDTASLQFFVTEAKKDPDIVYLEFLDPQGKSMLEGDQATNGKPVFKIETAEVMSPKNPDQVLGRISLAYTNEATKNVVTRLNLAILVSLVLVLASQILLVFFISRSIAGRIALISRQLKRTAEGSHESSAEMQSTSERLSSMASEQASAIQETVATLNQITSMVNKTVEHAAASAEKSVLNFQISLEANRTVGKMRESMEEIQSGINQFAQAVQRSNEQISGITSIISTIIQKTEVINDIVFQTKLLSFNASVEAARAGEHGKGFAVVAEEVGNLARMSGDAAREISKQLAESQQQVNSIVHETATNMQRLIEESNEKVSRGVALADECHHVLEEAVKHADQVKKNMEEVATAAREQAEGVHNINTAMSELDATTHMQADIAQSTSLTANRLAEQGTEIRSAVIELEQEIRGRRDRKPALTMQNPGEQLEESNITLGKTPNKTRLPTPEDFASPDNTRKDISQAS